MGEYGVAGQLARDSAGACQRLGDRIGVGFAHETLGQAELATGKLQSACTHLQIGLDVGQQSGKLNLTMDPLRWLGHLALIQGDVDLAIDYAHKALDTFENLQTVHSNYLSSIALLLGRAALAQQQHEEASAFFLKTMHAKGRAAWEAMDALAGLAEVHAYGGDSVLAVRMFTTVVNAMTTAELTRRHVDRFIEAQEVQVVMSPRATEKRG